MKILISLSSGIALDFEDHDMSYAPIFHYGVRDGVKVFFNNHFLLRGVGTRSTAYTIHHSSDLMKNRSFEPLGILEFVDNVITSLTLKQVWHGMGIGEEIVTSLLKTLNSPLRLSGHESLTGIKRNLGVAELLLPSDISILEEKASSCNKGNRLSNSWGL